MSYHLNKCCVIWIEKYANELLEYRVTTHLQIRYDKLNTARFTFDHYSYTEYLKSVLQQSFCRICCRYETPVALQMNNYLQNQIFIVKYLLSIGKKKPKHIQTGKNKLRKELTTHWQVPRVETLNQKPGIKLGSQSQTKSMNNSVPTRCNSGFRGKNIARKKYYFDQATVLAKWTQCTGTRIHIQKNTDYFNHSKAQVGFHPAPFHVHSLLPYKQPNKEQQENQTNKQIFTYYCIYLFSIS